MQIEPDQPPMHDPAPVSAAPAMGATGNPETDKRIRNLRKVVNLYRKTLHHMTFFYGLSALQTPASLFGFVI